MPTPFEESTSQRLEHLLQPPQQVKNWLDETEFHEWRESIQSQRVMTDRELFERFVPDVLQSLSE